MNSLLRIGGWMLALAVVALPVVAVLNGWVGASQWPLTRLRATGEFHRVDGALLRATLMPYAKRGFFAVDLEAARVAVEKLPWVETAVVRKRWPDVLEVHVTEHRPFARWGDDRILSEQGRLFPAKGMEMPKGLPQFRGPEARATEIVELYNESRALFASVGIDVAQVELDARGSWALALGNGSRVILGRSEARARLGRFIRLLPQLLNQDAQRLTLADLRYTNGFALSWEKSQLAGNDADVDPLPTGESRPGEPRSASTHPIHPSAPKPTPSASGSTT